MIFELLQHMLRTAININIISQYIQLFMFNFVKKKKKSTVQKRFVQGFVGRQTTLNKDYLRRKRRII